MCKEGFLTDVQRLALSTVLRQQPELTSDARSDALLFELLAQQLFVTVTGDDCKKITERMQYVRLCTDMDHALRARMMEQNQVDIAAPEIRQAVELLADDDNAVAFNEKNGTVMLR